MTHLHPWTALLLPPVPAIPPRRRVASVPLSPSSSPPVQPFVDASLSPPAASWIMVQERNGRHPQPLLLLLGGVCVTAAVLSHTPCGTTAAALPLQAGEPRLRAPLRQSTLPSSSTSTTGAAAEGVCTIPNPPDAFIGSCSCSLVPFVGLDVVAPPAGSEDGGSGGPFCGVAPRAPVMWHVCDPVGTLSCWIQCVAPRWECMPGGLRFPTLDGDECACSLTSNKRRSVRMN